jgi:hypothetical protein
MSLEKLCEQLAKEDELRRETIQSELGCSQPLPVGFSSFLDGESDAEVSACNIRIIFLEP